MADISISIYYGSSFSKEIILEKHLENKKKITNGKGALSVHMMPYIYIYEI